ncbi:DUF1206 domain-containing protein [Amycolatopsis sp. NPDC050768]|uniref:DUF1206 domain-containing protein n=1 Tax=Amycolatopsis sp. NPDC050768 TaxID=3154839 RepID=UPI003408F7A1
MNAVRTRIPIGNTRRSTTAQALGRAGMACYGVVHLIVAYLALRIAFGGGSDAPADQNGALQEIGSNSFGLVVLWVLAIGLLAFGLWQVLMAATGYEWVSGGERVRKRLGAAGRAIVVFALGYSAIRIAVGAGSAAGNQRQQEATAKLLSLPAGPAIVVVAACCVAAVAVAAGVKGVRRSFMEDLDTFELPRATRRWVARLGTGGYLAKGVVFAVIAVLLGYAGLRSDARAAGGLDAALRTLAGQPFGTVLLTIVALGLAAFGAYCFGASWAHRR